MNITASLAQALFRLSAPAATLTFASLALELLAPGIIARWISLPVYLFSLLAIAFLGAVSRTPTAGKSLPSKINTYPILVGAALLALVVAAVALESDWRFLIFFILATLAVANSLTRNALTR